jgi:N-acetylglucosamine-6-sulfatase
MPYTTSLRSLSALASCLLCALLGLTILSCSDSGSDGGERASGRPNIVLILTSGMRADAIGFAPRPFLGIKTPHMTRLAIEGTRFGNTFVTTSEAEESRASFLTGRYANSRDAPNAAARDGEPTPGFPERLQSQGYASAYIGEPPGEAADAFRPRGFDAWAVHTGESDGEAAIFDVGGDRRSVAGEYTERVTEMAVEWLDGRGPDQPFLLVLAHRAPAPPLAPDPARSSIYDEIKIGYPRSLLSLDTKPAWQSKGINGPNGIFGPLYGFREHHPDQSVEGKLAFKRFILAYAAAIHRIDESLGRILAKLEEKGVLDDTIVVLSSTHGYLLGEQGRIGGGVMYEPSIRVPLVVRYPERLEAMALIEYPILPIDLGPSLLDYAAVRPIAGLHGTSWVPLLEGRSEKWRSAWHYVYDADEGSDVPTIRGVRTDRWKIVQYPELPEGNHLDRSELYDLENDPTEVENLADEPQHTALRASLLGELAGLLDETGTHPSPAEPSGSRGPGGAP